MLQRAASNAYSWWWASRIRTSQSKWLDGNLEEMDDRVKIILKLLGEEADSFAKRAEMYYKRRPEVISNVEEAYRAYRALAERYDHVSGELHKANHTIATAFPEQVQYAMLEDDDEDDSEHVPKAITPIDPTKIRKSTVEGLLQKRKKEKERGSKRPKSSQPKLAKEKAQAEINRLQKAILVLQTEKEFIKSSYESGISKYWELEKQMAEMQESVILIQEESGEAGTVIEDDDARALMTATALKSCEEAILKLQQTHKESIELVRVESERIRVAIERLRSIKEEGDVALGDEESQSQPLTHLVNDQVEVNQQVQHMQLEVIMEKVKKHFELNPETSVEEIAEKIDEVVGKVIELELTVSSQTAQIGRLSEENVSLEKNLEELEKGKSGLIKNSDELNKRLKEVEEELKRVKESEKMVKDEERVFNAEFSDVVTSLNDISSKFEPGYKEDEFKNLVGYENIDVVNEAGEKEDGNNEIVLTGGTVEKVKEEERDINSDNLEKFEPGVDVRENVEDKNLIISENIPVINEAGMSGEKKLLIKQNLEELSKEDEHKNLVNSENISARNEVDMSGEKDLLKEEDKNSEVAMTSGPIEELKEDENNLISDISNKDNADEYKNLVNAENTNEKDLSKEEDKKCEVVLTSGPVEQVKEEERDIMSDDVSEKYEPVVDVRENAEISRESNVEALINSESNINQINDNEAQISVEKDLIKDQSSELMSIVSLPEKEKEKEKGESDVKNDEKESNEDFEKIPEEIKEINEEKEAKEIEKNKKQKWSILNEIMETDSPKFEKNKKTYKRGISLQQGEREYASLSERLPNFREERESVMSWQELLLDGLEGRDSILLAEYTSILRNYKETKRRLNELEERNQNQFNETSRVVRELRKDNALKDDEIRVLKQLISSLKMNNSEGKNVISEGVINEEESLEREKEVQVEEKLKGDIDSILDENFKFMLRFSASLNRIQDFESKFKHLQSEMKIETEKENEISNLEATSSENETKVQKPETTEKKLKDLKTEIEVWVEQIWMLKQELKTRVSSLNTTQDEISQAVRASSATGGSRLSVYQGEVLSMQQEADKAEEELKAGLNIVTGIHLKIESDLGKIRESFEMPKMESEVRWNSFEKYPSKTRVPLRNFLFGPKPKKKNKFFALLNPIIQKHLRDIKAKGKHLVKS